MSDTTTTGAAAPDVAGESLSERTGAMPSEASGAVPPEASGEATAVAPSTPAPTGKSRGFRKVREGLVVSDKMTKTVVVAVEDRVQHPLYGKTIRRTKRVKAHDENSACGIGDRVLLMETRPLSATKRWRVVDILEKAK